MSQVQIKSVQAVNLRRDFPNTNHYSDKRIYVAQNDEGFRTGTSVLRFPLPAPRGATYKSVKIRLYVSDRNSWPVGNTYRLGVARVTSDWDPAKATWSKAPSMTTVGAVEKVYGGLKVQDFVEFDITSMMNTVSSTPSMEWYGLVLYQTNSGPLWRIFYDARASNEFGPVVDAEWYDEPRQPQQLNPRSGQVISSSKPTLVFDFVDYGGNMNLAGYEIQISENPDLSSPLVSGEFNSSVPMHVMEDYAPSLALDTPYYWRVRVKDGEGLYSPWSTIESFSRQSPPTVSILNPAADPDNYIEDPTPPILWEYTSPVGSEQSGFEVSVYSEDRTQTIYESRFVSSSDESHTLDPNRLINKEGVWFEEGKNYLLQLRVYDSFDRTTTPTDTKFTETERLFRIEGSGEVSSVTDLTVSQVHRSNVVLLEWSRGTAPDKYVILRDGVAIEPNVMPLEVLVSGTDYQYYDFLAEPRVGHTWEVRAVAENVSSVGPTVSAKYNPTTAMLTNPADPTWITPLLDYSVNLDQVDGSEIHKPVNSPEAVVIYNRTSALTGTVSGIISSEGYSGPLETGVIFNRFVSMRDSDLQGTPLVLSYANQSIPCVISNISYSPVVFNEEICYAVNFSFAERGR